MPTGTPATRADELLFEDVQGGSFITNSAGAYDGNGGGGLQVVTDSDSVDNMWFHMSTIRGTDMERADVEDAIRRINDALDRRH